MGYAGCAVSRVFRQLDESQRESLGYAGPIVMISRVFRHAWVAGPSALPVGIFRGDYDAKADAAPHCAPARRLLT
jgi:hypothetical protein